MLLIKRTVIGLSTGYTDRRRKVCVAIAVVELDFSIVKKGDCHIHIAVVGLIGTIPANGHSIRIRIAIQISNGLNENVVTRTVGYYIIPEGRDHQASGQFFRGVGGIVCVGTEDQIPVGIHIYRCIIISVELERKWQCVQVTPIISAPILGASGSRIEQAFPQIGHLIIGGSGIGRSVVIKIVTNIPFDIKYRCPPRFSPIDCR